MMRVDLPNPALPRAIQSKALDIAKTEKAAEDFVAVTLGELLKPMFDTSDMSGCPFGGGPAEASFRPMMVTEIAKQIAHGGGALGLTAPVLQEMLRLEEAQ